MDAVNTLFFFSSPRSASTHISQRSTVLTNVCTCTSLCVWFFIWTIKYTKRTNCLSLTTVFSKNYLVFLIFILSIRTPKYILVCCNKIHDIHWYCACHFGLFGYSTLSNCFFLALFKNAVQLNCSLNTYIYYYCHWWPSAAT